MFPVKSLFSRKEKRKMELDHMCPIPSSKPTGQIKSLFLPEGMETFQACDPHGVGSTWKETSEVGRNVSQQLSHMVGVKEK